MVLQRMTLVVGRHANRVFRSISKPAGAAMSTLSSSSSVDQRSSLDFPSHQFFAALAALGTAAAAGAAAAVSLCEESAHPHFTPSQVANEAFPKGDENDEDEMQKYPIFTSDQVAENDGTDGKPVWMSVSEHSSGSHKGNVGG